MRHLRTVLRLAPGTEVEVFDLAGLVARAKLTDGDEAELLEEPRASVERTLVDVAAPLLKGDREDWLIEKLCELGVGTLTPLLSERAVIRELSSSKRARYERLIEAACKQSGRNMPMRIADPTPLDALDAARMIALDPLASASLATMAKQEALLVIGPEGGFSDAELRWIGAREIPRARLSDHILRAETAAVAAAAVCVSVLG